MIENLGFCDVITEYVGELLTVMDGTPCIVPPVFSVVTRRWNEAVVLEYPLGCAQHGRSEVVQTCQKR